MLVRVSRPRRIAACAAAGGSRTIGVCLPRRAGADQDARGRPERRLKPTACPNQHPDPEAGARGGRTAALHGDRPRSDTRSVAQTLTDLAAATRLARAIACDVALYHAPAVEQGLRDGRPFADLADELLEARALFLRRVAAALDPVPVLVRAFQALFERLAQQQGVATDGVAPALAAGLEREPGRLALQVSAGWHERIFPLGDGVQTIGRVPPADLEIDALTVSRRHARLIVDGDRVEVEDDESTGGILVNDAIVRAAPLAVGDRLRLGQVVFTLIRVAVVEPALAGTFAARDARDARDRPLLDALRRALARGGPQVLALCELDRLDRVVERHGRAISEALLDAVAGRLGAAAAAHGGAAIGRHGAALVVVLPGLDAHAHAEALRAAATREPVMTPVGPIEVTLSVGVAPRPDASGPSPEALLERARAACERAGPR